MPYTKRFKGTLYSPAWLRQEYLDKGRSSQDIAEELRTDASAVLRRLHRYGIPTRSYSEAQKLVPSPGSSAPRPKKNKDTLHSFEWLQAHYVERDMNASEIARLLQCSVPSVISALKKFGFEVKPILVAKRGRGRKPKTVLPDPCAACGGPACEINHIDRNHNNDRDSNHEALCERCHKRQHRIEELLALQKLIESGYSVLDLHEEARQILLDKPTERDQRWVMGVLRNVSPERQALQDRIKARGSARTR